MVKTIFREYDIRGIFEKELNSKSVSLIGYHLGKIIKQYGGIVAIGYDARTHSPIIQKYLISGLNYANCKVLNMEMVATPINYFSNYIKEFNINASIMITGSHNPPEYNGFKITLNKKPFFGQDIYSLGENIEKNIDIIIPENFTHKVIDVKSKYINYLVNHFKHLKNFKKKIIVDGGNGVIDTALSKIFNKLNFNFKGIYLDPDGNFPNHHPDPSEEKNLIDIKKVLKEENGEIAFAYDGDGDRVAILTPKYNIQGDKMAILFSKNLAKKSIIIGEVKCSQIMYNELNKNGFKTVMYKTGHSNLKVKIKELNAALACEVSGHIFFNDRYFGYDDATYATLRAIELLDKKIDFNMEMNKLPKVFSTDEIKISTTDDKKFYIIDKLKQILKNPPNTFPEILNIIEIDGVRINFKDGWGLIRASNTTPMLVTRFESNEKHTLLNYKSEINKIIKIAIEKI